MDLQKKEHRDIHQQMQLSQNKLHDHYESIRDAAEQLKYYFGNVQQREGETELSRQKYYDMLATKTYNENDRDTYFDLEQSARDVKDMYVQESQKLAFKCSTYVVYSYQHSEQREQFMTKMLKDVDTYYVDCENMKKERAKLHNHCGNLQTELQQCNATITQLEKEMQRMKEENTALQDSCNQYSTKQSELLTDKGNLQKANDFLNSTVSDMTGKNSSLTEDLNQKRNEASKLGTELQHCYGNISDLNSDIENRKQQQKSADENIAQLNATVKSLSSQLDDFRKRNNNLGLELTKTKEELVKTRRLRDKYQESTRQALKERTKMKEAYDKMKKDKETMEEQYTGIKHEREIVGKEKDRLVSREYRIKKRNQALTDDHKYLTKEVDDLREKYRRADERAKKDGSLKQELRDTIKRLHKEMEEERRRMIKVTRDVRIQTDPGLACESRDIAIQHAQFKMKQAIRARDQHVVELRRIKEMHERAQKAIEKKTHELGTFETKLKSAMENFILLEEKYTRAEKLVHSTKNELDREKALRIKLQIAKEESDRRIILVKQQVPPPVESRDVDCQTIEDTSVNAKEAELTLNLALCLQQKVEANKAELAQRLKELDVSKSKVTRLEKIIEQQKFESDILQRKVLHLEGKFVQERNYMRGIHKALAAKNLHPTTLGSYGVV